jgi:two-component system, LuxR family, sensor kinase FixL
MTWMTVAWPMAAAACITMGLIHLRIGFHQSQRAADLLFALTAFTVAAFSYFELALALAESPREYLALLRWVDLLAGALLVFLTAFVSVFLGTGRRWLAFVGPGVACASLSLDLLPVPKLMFLQITSVESRSLGGATYSVVDGIRNPSFEMFYLGVLLALVFVADATVTLWRQGGRRRAVLVGGSIVFFMLVAGAQGALVDNGVLQTPYFATFAFLSILVAMGIELSDDTLRATALAHDLHESEERMALAAEALQFGIWFWDFARNEFSATDGWRAFSDFRRSEPLAFDTFLQRVHPDDRESVRQALPNAFAAANGLWEMEYRVIRRDGQVQWVASRGAVETINAKPVRLRGVSMDITARKRAADQFRLAVEASPSGIVLVNGEGRITLINAETERLFGYSREELVGQTVDMLLPKQFRPDHPHHRSDFFAAPKARAMGAGRELFAVRKDGTEFPVEIGLNPIESADGTLVLTAVVDITARKRAELEAVGQRNELAHLARVTMLGELSGSIAHELNQPLTAILSNAQAGMRFLTHDSVDLDQVRDILADIVAQDNRASEVIQRLRLLLHKGEIQRQPVDVNEVVREVAKLVRSDLTHQHVTLHSTLAPVSPVVIGDRVQLQQVLLNLVMNACEAMHTNAPSDRRVVVRTELLGGNEVRLSVSDQGTGIAPDKLTEVLEPFFTTKTNGLGLGLSVCRTIVKAHSGALSVANNPDRGATVHVSLPASPALHPSTAR